MRITRFFEDLLVYTMVYCGVNACVPVSVLFCFMETQQQHGGSKGLLFFSGHSGLAASISGVVWKSDSLLSYATFSFLPVEGAKYFFKVILNMSNNL